MRIDFHFHPVWNGFLPLLVVPRETAMASGVSRRVATISPGFVEQASPRQIAEYFDVSDPDLVVQTSGTGGRVRSLLERHAPDRVSLCDLRADPGAGWADRVDIPNIRAAPDTESLRVALETDLEIGPQGEPPIIITPVLELTVDTTTLSTTLHGRGALPAGPESSGSESAGREQGSTEAAGPDPASTDPADPEPADGSFPIVLSTGLPSGYRNRVAGCLLIGIGESDDPSESALLVVEVRGQSTVLTRSVEPDRLGLQALTEVGSKRAEILREAGYRSRSAVATADRAALQDLPGLGPEVVETIQASAKAIASGTVVRRSRAPISVRDPLFVDIETDGLHPTVTWLIGVLDGGPAEGTYRSFLNRDPDDPGAAIEAFVEWYVAEGDGRPLVAYNGRTFDFPVLRDHLRDYRPTLRPDLDSVERFDPYAWAVRDGNAALPGRTDRLDDVAGALGFDPATEGLTGAAVARRYRRWLEEPDGAVTLEWDRLDRYCEDDVRALARVYEALRASSEGMVVGDQSKNRTRGTTQGTLSDW